MDFPLIFLGALLVIGVFIACIKFIAEFDDEKPNADRDLKRAATPPHEYTNLDGTKGRWP